MSSLSTQTSNFRSANPITATTWNLFQSSLSNLRRYEPQEWTLGSDSGEQRMKQSIAFPINDPRYYQIAVLASLLLYGVGWLEFDIAWPQLVVSLGTALLVQYACTQISGLPSFDPRSPLVSGLSLCLL